MIYQESRHQRRIVGRLDRGDPCIDRLEEFCDEHDIRAGEVRAVGRLSTVELVRFDTEEGEYDEIFTGEGTFDLLQLNGNVSTVGDRPVVRLQALLAADGPAGPQLLAGQLRSGEVFEFEFVIDVYGDLAIDRHRDDETGMLTIQSIRRTESDEPEDEEAPSMEGQSMSWDEAADGADVGDEPSETVRESDDSSPNDEPDEDGAEPDESETTSSFEGLEEPLVDAGDIIDHPKLGRCRVIKIEDGEYVHIRIPQGRIRKLSLNVLELTHTGEEKGRDIFEAEVNP